MIFGWSSRPASPRFRTSRTLGAGDRAEGRSSSSCPATRGPGAGAGEGEDRPRPCCGISSTRRQAAKTTASRRWSSISTTSTAAASRRCRSSPRPSVDSAVGQEGRRARRGLLAGQYYVAAQADEIYLDPLGFVAIDGYGCYRTYYKDRSTSSASTSTCSASAPQERRRGLHPHRHVARGSRGRASEGALWASYKAESAEARGLEPAHPGLRRRGGGRRARDRRRHRAVRARARPGRRAQVATPNSRQIVAGGRRRGRGDRRFRRSTGEDYLPHRARRERRARRRQETRSA